MHQPAASSPPAQAGRFIDSGNRQLVARAVEFLWANARCAELVAAKRNGWIGHIALEIGADPVTLRRAIDALGRDEFRNIVASSPAGDSPLVVEAEVLMASTHGSCLHQTGTCASCLHQTGTCGTCAACIGPDGTLLN
jgi:hypothetical protein